LAVSYNNNDYYDYNNEALLLLLLLLLLLQLLQLGYYYDDDDDCHQHHYYYFWLLFNQSVFQEITPGLGSVSPTEPLAIVECKIFHRSDALPVSQPTTSKH